jgi:hypothetical protein
MRECWVSAISTRRHLIRERWEALLRAERANSPLANPDALAHLIEWTLDEVLKELRRPRAHNKGTPVPSMSTLREGCHCGRNPYFIHFMAGEQAMLEALVIVQAEASPLDPEHRDAAVAELYTVTRQIARREVDAFCSLCQHRSAVTATQPTKTQAATL